MDKRIFSGDNSRDFWKEINAIDAMSTGDDIHGALYSLGCLLQKMEDRIVKQAMRLAVLETSLTNPDE